MIGLESSDSQSETSEHSVNQIKVALDQDQCSLGSPSDLDLVDGPHLMETFPTGNICLPSGCPLGNRCPFKENAIQAWNVSKDMADQREELVMLKNKVIQLQNINEENKNYIEALRGNDESLKRTIERQQEELLRYRQEIVSLRLQINQITKAAMAQLFIRPPAQQLTTDHIIETSDATVQPASPIQTAQSPPIATVQPASPIQTAQSPPIATVQPASPTQTAQSPPIATVQPASPIQTAQSPPIATVQPASPIQTAQSPPIATFQPASPIQTAQSPPIATFQPASPIQTAQSLPIATVQPASPIQTAQSPPIATVQPASPIQTAQSLPIATVQPASPIQTAQSPPIATVQLASPIITDLPGRSSPITNVQTAQLSLSSRRRKNMIFFALIVKSPFFEELQQQQLIEDLSDLMVLEKPKQKYFIDEVVKIVRQESAPKLAILRISKKLGVPKNQATLLYTEAKRKTAAERCEQMSGKRKRMSSEEEDEEQEESTSKKMHSHDKEQIPKALMPWRPIKRVLPVDMRNSALSWEDHRNYVAIIQNKLKSAPTFRFEHDMKKINAWDEVLKEERQLYLDTALRTTKSAKKYPNSLFIYPEPSVLTALMNHQNKKAQSQLGDREFQGTLLEIPWMAANAHSQQLQQQPVALMRFRVTLLQPGNGKVVRIPDTRQRFIVKLNHKNIEKKISTKLEKKMPLSHDEVIKNLALQNDIEFMMDGSTLRHLLSAPFGQKPQISYACRVSIKMEFREGKMKRICYVYPPLIASRLHRPFIIRQYFKWALKLELSEDAQKSEAKGRGGLLPKRVKIAETADSLLDELQLGNIGEKAGTSDADAAKRYAIVEFGGEEQGSEQYRVMVRTNVHGIEDSCPISLSVRPEFLPEIAAEKMSEEEILSDLVTATLKGSKEHLTFRLHFDDQAHQLHLMQIDRKTASDFSKIDQESRKLLSTRIQRFCTLLDAFRQQNQGEYLLVHDDDILRLVREKNIAEAKRMMSSDNQFDQMGGLCIQEEDEEENVVPSSGPVYNFGWIKNFTKMKPILSHAPIEDYWNGIDPHYPLQWHIVHGQIPGALYPKKIRNWR